MSDNLTVVAHAKEEGKWVDLDVSRQIPVDSLEPAELNVLGDENEMEDLS
jgi:hypothetical protein